EITLVHFPPVELHLGYCLNAGVFGWCRDMLGVAYDDPVEWWGSASSQAWHNTGGRTIDDGNIDELVTTLEKFRDRPDATDGEKSLVTKLLLDREEHPRRIAWNVFRFAAVHRTNDFPTLSDLRKMGRPDLVEARLGYKRSLIESGRKIPPVPSGPIHSAT